jgi:hypothetical protein
VRDGRQNVPGLRDVTLDVLVVEVIAVKLVGGLQSLSMIKGMLRQKKDTASLLLLPHKKHISRL